MDQLERQKILKEFFENNEFKEYISIGQLLRSEERSLQLRSYDGPVDNCPLETDIP